MNAPVEVTQSDRDAAADIWHHYVAKVGEVMVEKGMRSGELDSGLPLLLARHRLAHTTPTPGEGYRALPVQHEGEG